MCRLVEGQVEKEVNNRPNDEQPKRHEDGKSNPSPDSPPAKDEAKDHGMLNSHVTSIEDIDGNVLWRKQ
jgi:hypothetical protein